MAITVLLADDHNIFRMGIRSLLELETDLTVIADTGDGVQAVELARQLVPDVAVLDISMPLLNGIEAARAIVENNLGTKVIILSMYYDKEYISSALMAGASGFLAKNCTPSDLADAIRSVVAGKPYLSHTISSALVELVLAPPAVHPATSTDPKQDQQLSRRENEVLRLLAEGNCTKEVAALLGISAKTVESYRLNLMKKLNILNIAGLVRYAIRQGIVDSD